MEASILPSCHSPTNLFVGKIHRRRLSALHATGPAANSNSSSSSSRKNTNNDETKADNIVSSTPANQQPRPPVNTLNIRYRPRSRKRAMEEQQQKQKTKAPPPPKEWESMTVAEKAMELYVGEKGLLFWLNKFAYASIFIIIGGWILFRFVGPSLGLYQLDAPPLSPTNILKGSS